MPTDITTPVHAAPIKWTDDEWNKIVVQLYHLKGKGALESDGVAEIKARDVFEAQDVLPIERRRKQISIAQGFEGIRTRLRGLFKRGQQENLFACLAPESTGVTCQVTTPVTNIVPNSTSKGYRSLQAAKPDLFGESDLASHGISEDVQRSHTTKVGTTGDVQPAQVAGVVPTTGELDQRLHEAPQPATMATNSPPTRENTRPGRLLGGYGSQAAKEKEQPGVSLTELARPFVAMVCEELVRAFGQTSSGQGILSILSERLQADTVKAVRQFDEPRRRDNQRGKDHIRIRLRDDDREARRPHVAELQNDEISQPMDVQPLFDPKLPPSANSDFKPMIGLVATRAHEYEDLQMLYPQLRLSIVPAADITGPETFRNCQRIIGLREELPQATDDMLKRTLRYRYIRLSGGADSVREQLDAWLANPNAMQNGPRASALRDRKSARNGNVNKKGKWPPRVA